MNQIKKITYLCFAVSSLCVGVSFLIISLKYQSPKESALDKYQNSLFKQMAEGLDSQ